MAFQGGAQVQPCAYSTVIFFLGFVRSVDRVYVMSLKYLFVVSLLIKFSQNSFVMFQSVIRYF